MRSEGYSTWSVCLSVTTFSAATRNETAKKRYQRVQCHTGFIFKIGDFDNNAAFESYGVKQVVGSGKVYLESESRSIVKCIY